MAYVYPHQRRTVPPPFFYDLRPATPPIVPVAVINPYFLQSVPHQIEFVVPNPPVLRPFGFTLNHAAIIQMDEQRTQALIQFISKEGLVPSPEEESKRKNAIDQLKQTVQLWVKKVAWQRRLPKSHIYCASATILTYGSYGLGVHGSDSDIDALCIGPFYASIVDDFFIVLRNMLSSGPEVTELHCVKNAKVPLMRFKFNGISVDLPYAQLPIISVPDLEEVQGFCDPNPTEYVDHKEPQLNTVFYWGLSSIKSSFIDIRSVREDFMRSVENGYQGSSGCRLELSIIGSSQLLKDAQSGAGIGKGSRAFWRNPDYNDRRKPIYSQHLPCYFVGYVADDQDGYPSSAG